MSQNFYQRPSWTEEEMFSFNSTELTALFKLNQEFSSFQDVMNSAFARFIDEGKIKVRYFNEKDEEVDKDTILNHIQKQSEQLKDSSNSEPTV
jgi:uncharacterized protein YicC (UPF0701 family)